MAWKTKEEQKAYNDAYRAKNRETILAQKRAKYHENVELSRAVRAAWKRNNPERQLQIDLKSQAKIRARDQGVPFDISVDDVVVPEVCPILGIKLERNTNPWAHDASPTLDKIIPEKGYVKGNIAVISHRANSLKGSFSLSEFRSVVDYMENYTY